MKFKISKQLYNQILSGVQQLKQESIKYPRIVNEPLVDDSNNLIQISPIAEEQPSNFDLPVDEKDWVPHNKDELGLAIQQLAKHIPDNEVKWFYKQMQKLVDKALDNVDPQGERSRPISHE